MLASYSLDKFGVEIRMRYSTVDEYLRALSEAEPNAMYPIYKGDFFPYLQEVECEQAPKTCSVGARIDHWNGYYSTRTAFKTKVRELLAYSRSSQKLYASLRYLQMTRHPDIALQRSYGVNYREAQEQASILLHHDAITGTHSLSTKQDYEERIKEATQLIADTNMNALDVLDQALHGIVN